MTSAATGAVPATIAVLGGVIHVGLEPAELERLAQTQGALKLSRADLAAALAMGATGATTVAATMICAARAGIGVFATGGIGGVHRGAETSFDISADLQELAQTAVTVVAAGAKAILDLPKNAGKCWKRWACRSLPMGKTAFPPFGRATAACPRPCGWMTRARLPMRICCGGGFGPARRATGRQPDPRI